eukprot:8613836-Lingulodinium_polyedra.AAC.1
MPRRPRLPFQALRRRPPAAIAAPGARSARQQPLRAPGGGRLRAELRQRVRALRAGTLQAACEQAL